MKDVNTEMQICGGIIYEGSNVMEVLSPLRVQDEWFTDEACRLIYTKAKTLYVSGKPISWTDLDDIITPETMEKMVDGWQSIAHTEHLCDKLREMHQRREIVKTCKALIGDASNIDVDIEQARSKAELAISELTTRVDTSRSPIDVLQCAVDDWQRAADTGSCIGVRTGFRSIDKGFGGLMKSSFYVFSGKAGSCKTTLARNIIENVAELGHKVSFLSLEQTAQQIMGSIAARYAKQSVFFLNCGNRTRANVDLVREQMEFVASLPITVEERPHNRDELLSWGRREVSRGAELLVIDYIQRVQANKYEGRDSDEQKIAKTSTALADLAKETGIPVLAISALSREGNLRGSGMLDYDAYCHLKLGKGEDWSPENLVYEASFEKARFGPTIGNERMMLLGEEGRLVDESIYLEIMNDVG